MKKIPSFVISNLREEINDKTMNKYLNLVVGFIIACLINYNPYVSPNSCTVLIKYWLIILFPFLFPSSFLKSYTKHKLIKPSQLPRENLLLFFCLFLSFILFSIPSTSPAELFSNTDKLNNRATKLWTKFLRIFLQMNSINLIF